LAFNDVYNSIFDKVKTDLKTLSGLADDVTVTPTRERVLTEHGNTGNKTGEYSAILQIGPIEDLGGVTTQSNLFEFTLILDLSYFGQNHNTSKTALLSMISLIYDKFNLTTLGGLVRICKVTTFPEDSTVPNLYTHFSRLLIKCEKTVFKA